MRPVSGANGVALFLQSLEKLTMCPASQSIAAVVVLLSIPFVRLASICECLYFVMTEALHAGEQY